jgi:hypothetical protein
LSAPRAVQTTPLRIAASSLHAFVAVIPAAPSVRRLSRHISHHVARALHFLTVKNYRRSPLWQ